MLKIGIAEIAGPCLALQTIARIGITTEPDDADGAAADTPPPIALKNQSSTGWTVTSQPHNGAPVRVALPCGAALNLTALASLATIVLDGPLWLATTLTVATALLAIATRRAMRTISTGGDTKPSPPQQTRQ